MGSCGISLENEKTASFDSDKHIWHDRGRQMSKVKEYNTLIKYIRTSHISAPAVKALTARDSKAMDS